MMETKLRAWRKARGITQQKAADLFGLSQAAYCRIDDGTSFPDPTTISAIVYVTTRLGPFPISVQDLMDGWQKKHPMTKNERARLAGRVDRAREESRGKESLPKATEAQGQEASR